MRMYFIITLLDKQSFSIYQNKQIKVTLVTQVKKKKHEEGNNEIKQVMIHRTAGPVSIGTFQSNKCQNTNPRR